jgi:hypothetical protein
MRRCKPSHIAYRKLAIWLGEHADKSEMAMSKMIGLGEHLLGKISSQCNETAPLDDTTLISFISSHDPIFWGRARLLVSSSLASHIESSTQDLVHQSLDCPRSNRSE